MEVFSFYPARLHLMGGSFFFLSYTPAPVGEQEHGWKFFLFILHSCASGSFIVI
jgi:hypothetical protein